MNFSGLLFIWFWHSKGTAASTEQQKGLNCRCPVKIWLQDWKTSLGEREGSPAECSAFLLAKKLSWSFRLHLPVTASFGLDCKEVSNLYRKQTVKLQCGVIFLFLNNLYLGVLSLSLNVFFFLLKSCQPKYRLSFELKKAQKYCNCKLLVPQPQVARV